MFLKLNILTIVALIFTEEIKEPGTEAPTTCTGSEALERILKGLQGCSAGVTGPNGSAPGSSGSGAPSCTLVTSLECPDSNGNINGSPSGIPPTSAPGSGSAGSTGGSGVIVGPDGKPIVRPDFGGMGDCYKKATEKEPVMILGGVEVPVSRHAPVHIKKCIK